MTQISDLSQSSNFLELSLLDYKCDRKNAFEQITQRIEAYTPKLEQSVFDIAKLTETVCKQSLALQNKTETPPPNLLIRQKNAFLEEYHNFKAIYEEAELLTEYLQVVITVVTPTPRSSERETFLRDNSSDFYAKIKQSETICLNYIAELKTTHNIIHNLNERLLVSLNNTELTYSLQRFCEIVDNNGAPLSLCSQFTLICSHFMFPLDIPEPDKTEEFF